MKFIGFIFLLLISFSNNIIGNYEYRSSHFKENIELFENNQFSYQCTIHMAGTTKVNGYYQIINDSLILSSSPQKDKIIVRENSKGKFENKLFKVTDKDGHLITFHLYITLKDNSQLEFRDCFDKVNFKSIPIKSFYLKNTVGLKSPIYSLKGTHTNFYEIQFETTRVFDNEAWELKNGNIRPRGFDLQLQNYYLKKKS